MAGPASPSDGAAGVCAPLLRARRRSSDAREARGMHAAAGALTRGRGLGAGANAFALGSRGWPMSVRAREVVPGRGRGSTSPAGPDQLSAGKRTPGGTPRGAFTAPRRSHGGLRGGRIRSARTGGTGSESRPLAEPHESPGGPAG